MKLSLLVATAAMLVTQVYAAEPAEIRTERVQFADLRLDTPEGLHKLLRRLESAAARVCGDGHDRGITPPAVSRCRDRALESAIAQIGDPRLAQYVARKHKLQNG
jgi:UrcA family protein